MTAFVYSEDIIFVFRIVIIPPSVKYCLIMQTPLLKFVLEEKVPRNSDDNFQILQIWRHARTNRAKKRSESITDLCPKEEVRGDTQEKCITIENKRRKLTKPHQACEFIQHKMALSKSSIQPRRRRLWHNKIGGSCFILQATQCWQRFVILWAVSNRPKGTAS